jgi:hypothetical protein
MTRKSPVAEWLRTLAEPPECQILQTVSKEQGPAAEKYWIELLSQVPCVDLLNIHYGPVPGRSHIVSEETRAKMRGRGVSERNVFSRGESRGELNWNAKLSDDDIRVIKASKDSQTTLARRYGVTQPAISYIRNNRRWKHIDSEPIDQVE